ncbi:MAG: hypothetical protein JRI63_13595 [Deltaproteobacteria bacterium]|nr:hypothetical protein [Deltaproteobacteria bacterium]
MGKPGKKRKREVAFQDGTIATESGLPLPVVHYPGFYGAFFGFSEEPNTEIYFCSCAKLAIEHYIRFRLEDEESRNSDPERNFILSKSKFPQRLVRDFIEACKPKDASIINRLRFRNDLCHECNKLTPLYGYCVPMYGGAFEQNYGWYINKQSFEYGVMPVSFKILGDVCPDEVFSANDLDKQVFIDTYSKLREHELILLKARDSDFQKKTRKIRNIIENEVRVKFGFKKVGEAWANETLLFQMISEILPDEELIRHYRPGFLDNLELDIFIPSLNIGIEYQGLQHFEPIQHWGGETALERTKERDSRKKALCRKNGIDLIYFYYTEELSSTLVKEKLCIHS